MHQIRFTSNPNGKLFLHHFMDVRLFDDEKYATGNVLEVILNNKVVGMAKVVAVKPFKYSHLNDTFSFMNCGKHAAYQASLLQRYYVNEIQMQPDTRLMQIVFTWTERNMELFEFLLKEWWQKIVDAQPDHLKKSNNNG